MRPGPKKFRYVEDDSDGVEVWQCLHCKGKFGMRFPSPRVWTGVTGHVRFCPFCGVAWEGEHTWNEERPRYYPAHRIAVSSRWQLFQRVWIYYDGPEVPRWREHRDPYPGTAHEIATHLRTERRYHDGEVEFQVEIVKEKPVPLPR